jgi:hypothetical protein
MPAKEAAFQRMATTIMSHLSEAAIEELEALVKAPNAVDLLTKFLPQRYPAEVDAGAWDWSGFALYAAGRVHEALTIHWSHYLNLLESQTESTRLHKGTPLIRISDCFKSLGFPVHTKRHLMLTLCEDAIDGKGEVSPQTTGAYYRLIWSGVTHDQLSRYATKFFELSQSLPEQAQFPEALLQRLDTDWLTEFPSQNEALFYRINPIYVESSLRKLGDGTGEALELLAEYLMSCMAGCRTRRRQLSGSTDYDIICSMEGFELDFRSEFGRHFVCECKDWHKAADFTVMAKFCRVLDSTKSRFGILFSKNGVSGAGATKYADREQLKFFQYRGSIVVVLDENDLTKIAKGTNLIALLRTQYETVRLDLRPRCGA